MTRKEGNVRYTANKWFGIPSGKPVWNILKFRWNLWCSRHQSVQKYLTEALRFDFDFAPQKVRFWRNSSVNKKITAKWNSVGRNHWKNINAHCIRTRHESCPLQQIPMLFPQPQGQTEEANQAFILLRRFGSEKETNFVQPRRHSQSLAHSAQENQFNWSWHQVLLLPPGYVTNLSIIFKRWTYTFTLQISL